MRLRPIHLAPLLVLLLAGCAGKPPPPLPGEPRDPAPAHSVADEMMKYDLNHDGSITLNELNTGLKAEFDAADTNHDGRLEPDEVREVNAARAASGDEYVSPLIDYKQHGYIDFEDFAAGSRALFSELDRNGDGVLTPDELHPRARQHHAQPPPISAPYGNQR